MAPQVRDDVGETALGDLERGERHHRVAERDRIDVGPEPGDDAAREELVETRLRGSPGDTEGAGQVHHAGPGGMREVRDQPGVEVVDGGRFAAHTDQSVPINGEFTRRIV